MNDLSRTMMIAGAVLFFAGAFFALAGKVPGLGRLPGDIVIKKENFSFYFPLATCLLLSILISLLLQFVNRK